ncbi:MAG TPA: cbb3-type cytochrome c oxidase subunit II [Rariglobus sp.]|nr:cbb3-type cytochrome c oxidase subunit II [Rariglobus sp.]
MSEREVSRKEWVAAVVMIAATYGYFLIFAQFAFLELLTDAVGADGLRGAMGAMGVGGVAGSVLAVWRFRAETYAGALRGGAVVCVVAAVPGASVWTAAVIGLALGWLTVTLASGLRAAVGIKRLGLVAGAGTGVAYAACNVPWVFHAEPRVQAWCGVALMVIAAGATFWLRAEAGDVSTSSDFGRRRVAAWAVIFMALVWMDSAAFYIIQHTAELRAGTWGANGSLWLNAGVHFGVAVGTGAVLDRGWLGRVALAAWAALALACVALGVGVREFAGAEILYAAGVSLYSVALVYYPARGGRAWVAGVVFSVAGWLGSALGIGMAQDLHAVPTWFVCGAGVVVAGLLLVRQRARFGTRQPLLIAVFGIGSLTFPAADGRAEGLSASGREVFVGEGCIHCHSQFVRPGTKDVLWWGPEKPLAESLKEVPPLLGNRRQGPDLTQVGNRRSPEWNRLHLIAPRVVSPGSRMPSYAHLFREGDGRGEALVAYLASLGAETVERRAAQVAAWKPMAGVVADAEKGGRLFAGLCVNCHGVSGRGDGVLAKGLSVRPPDWPRDGARRTGDEEAVARMIKFGFQGSPMAGHEYLKDDEVVSLARYVRSLQGGAKLP